MDRINIYGRTVYPVTTLQGQRYYYDYMNYWHSCMHNTNLRIIPTEDDAREYLNLKEEKPSRSRILEERIRYNKLQTYENNYDWRPKKTGEPHLTGLVSPAGEQLLPNIFEDVFIQFDTMHGRPDFVPVSNGDGWALVSIGSSPVLMTEFRYNAIIQERWERKLFFVQDKETLKWGVISTICQSTNAKPHGRHYLETLEPIMPCIADEIYEDQFMVDDPDEMPSLFFMVRAGNKVGVLTDCGYSETIYDKYETNSRDCSFRLIRNDRKRARRANWWQPSGKRSILKY